MPLLIAMLLLAQGQGSPSSLSASASADASGRLSAADLPAYLQALGEPIEESGSAADSAAIPNPTFTELWRDPSSFRDRRIRVQGRAARRFRQDAVGDFPPLVELWLVDAGRNPICVVYPAPVAGSGSDSDSEPKIGETVAFTGRFLRLLSYPGEDAERLAPLIVGPQPPIVAISGGTSSAAAQSAWSAVRRWEWLVAGALASAIGLAFLTLRQRRPRPQSRSRRHGLAPAESEPVFVDRSDPSDPPERTEDAVG